MCRAMTTHTAKDSADFDRPCSNTSLGEERLCAYHFKMRAGLTHPITEGVLSIPVKVFDRDDKSVIWEGRR